MKRIYFVLVLLFSIHSFAQDDQTSSLNWLTDLEEAKIESAKTNKPVLIYFTGSDWCAPCKMLKADFFGSDEFEKKAEQLVLLMIDIPRRQDIITAEQRKKNMSVVMKFNKKGSYPTLVAINHRGKVLNEISGYTFLRETDRHFAFIESVLAN